MHLTERLPSIDTNWRNYKYSTDTGIVTEIVQKKLNRDPTFSEIELIKSKFVQLWALLHK
jgi:hypothetical protein